MRLGLHLAVERALMKYLHEDRLVLQSPREILFSPPLFWRIVSFSMRLKFAPWLTRAAPTGLINLHPAERRFFILQPRQSL